MSGRVEAVIAELIGSIIDLTFLAEKNPEARGHETVQRAGDAIRRARALLQDARSGQNHPQHHT